MKGIDLSIGFTHGPPKVFLAFYIYFLEHFVSAKEPNPTIRADPTDPMKRDFAAAEWLSVSHLAQSQLFWRFSPTFLHVRLHVICQVLEKCAAVCKQIVVSRNSCPLQIVAFASRAHVKFGAAAIDVQNHVSPTKRLETISKANSESSLRKTYQIKPKEPGLRFWCAFHGLQRRGFGSRHVARRVVLRISAGLGFHRGLGPWARCRAMRFWPRNLCFRYFVTTVDLSRAGKMLIGKNYFPPLDPF